MRKYLEDGFELIGKFKARYGEFWQTPLAREIGLNFTTVNRWSKRDEAGAIVEVKIPHIYGAAIREVLAKPVSVEVKPRGFTEGNKHAKGNKYRSKENRERIAAERGAEEA